MNVAVHGENQVKLKELSSKHKDVASSLAQGLGRQQIAEVIGYTPEYITWLARDPLFKQYLREMSEYNDARLEALFEQVPEVINDAMRNGTVEERLKGARLQLEVTGRIGKLDRPSGALDTSLERLNTLASRLLALQTKVRTGDFIDVQGQTIDLEQAHGSGTFDRQLQIRGPEVGNDQPAQGAV
jgi:hypothetical protein